MREYRAVLFGEPDENGRRDQPAGRMAPARQRLVAAQRAAAQLLDRLDTRVRTDPRARLRRDRSPARAPPKPPLQAASNTRIRPRPWRLASYSAKSACRSNSVMSRPWRGYTAEPTLALDMHRRAFDLERSRQRLQDTVSERLGAFRGGLVAARQHTNSSPPMRATSARAILATALSRRAASTMTASPAACPSESLISLNRSRSTTQTEQTPARALQRLGERASEGVG